MVFQKGVVTNPTGNMELKNARKTGPRTNEGKLRSLVSTGLLNTGQQSKLIKRLRHCNKCPLGAKEEKFYVDGKPKIIFKPPKCTFYRKDGTNKCPFGIIDFTNRMKTYVELEKMGWDEAEVAKALTLDAIGDTIISRQMEMATSGHPKGYTHLHSNRALEAIKASHEMKFGKRQVTAFIGEDTAKVVVDRLFQKEEPKKVVEAESEEAL